MTDNQRAAFEAWYATHDPRTPQSPFDRELACKAWQAALESPEVQALRDVLREYADSNNWEKDEFGWRRIWREPGSTIPESYDGYELALSALAAMEKQHD
ncbi:hypothetical protein [Neopusillimonas aromaticivorans]|uniref:hypothetical protein n=1 Tax=Neopusillimonas aromaticivorans TaxID=2979868 RepID=UPI002594FBB1|nr:hypothetical protein [Neopusillimonas aromaticivorans]WJJ93400.1 hypothetical protein N7E01_15775 [Neopusillimonas aromaticivorans]